MKLSNKEIRKVKSRIKRKIKNCKNNGDYAGYVVNFNILKRYPLKRIRKLSSLQRFKSRVVIKAPRLIDYYREDSINKSNVFIRNIKESISHGYKVSISFDQTEYISAAAMISFLAEIELIVISHHPMKVIYFSHPRDKKIESILKQVGFYDLLKKEKRETPHYDDVNFWRFASGVCSEPIETKKMFQEIKAEIEVRASKKLYRGVIEAMANSVEHAYINQRDCHEEKKKWWCFAGIRDEQLIVVICDKGVGISRTLPMTQGSNLEKIFEILGITKRTDSAYIKTASSLRETRTGAKHRGKGIADMKRVVDMLNSARLTIFSNRGLYRYKGNDSKIRETLSDFKSSVNGTIVEWNIPLTKEASYE